MFLVATQLCPAVTSRSVMGKVGVTSNYKVSETPVGNSLSVLQPGNNAQTNI